MSETVNSNKLIKCASCGANITIEGDFCPYCGMAKSQFAEHRAQMAGYAQDYANVRAGVIEENKQKSRHSVYITILAVLAMVFLLEIVMMALNQPIFEAIERTCIRSHRTEHLAMLEKYEADADFDAFRTYYEYNNIRVMENDDAFMQYKLLYRYATLYSDFIDCMTHVAFRDYADSGRGERYVSGRIESLAMSYADVMRLNDEYADTGEIVGYYVDAVFDDTHIASYQLIGERMDLMMMNLLSFSEAELSEYKELMEPQQQAVIAQKYEDIRARQ